MVRNPASSGMFALPPLNPDPCDFSAWAITLIHLFPSIKHISYCAPGLLLGADNFYVMVGIPALYKFSVRRLMAFANTWCGKYLCAVCMECCEEKGPPTWQVRQVAT